MQNNKKKPKRESLFAQFNTTYLEGRIGYQKEYRKERQRREFEIGMQTLKQLGDHK